MTSPTSKHSHQTIYCLVRHNPTLNPVTMKMSKRTIAKNEEYYKFTLTFSGKDRLPTNTFTKNKVDK